MAILVLAIVVGRLLQRYTYTHYLKEAGAALLVGLAFSGILRGAGLSEEYRDKLSFNVRRGARA